MTKSKVLGWGSRGGWFRPQWLWAALVCAAAPLSMPARSGAGAGAAAAVVPAGPAGPRALTIPTTALPAVTAQRAYAQKLAVQGGVPPYRWLVTAGGFPAGLQLTADGCLEGVPAAPAEGEADCPPAAYVTVTDAAGNAFGAVFVLPWRSAPGVDYMLARTSGGGGARPGPG